MKAKSMIIIAILGICCASILAYLLIPRRQAQNVELSAVLFEKETSQTQNTSFMIDGQWSRQILSDTAMSFSGKIQTAALDYTKDSGNWDLSIHFVDVPGEEHLLGGIFYNNSNYDSIASAWLYTNREYSAFVFFDNDHIIISPAETVEDAHKICDALGLPYPDEA